MKKIVFLLFFTFSFVFAFEELTMENFEAKVKDKNAIVDFYAVWCPPCRILAQNLEDFSSIKSDNVEIFKVNIDEQMALARKYGVTALPTLIFIKNGKIVHKNIGILDANELLEESQTKFK